MAIYALSHFNLWAEPLVCAAAVYSWVATFFAELLVQLLCAFRVQLQYMLKISILSGKGRAHNMSLPPSFPQ